MEFKKQSKSAERLEDHLLQWVSLHTGVYSLFQKNYNFQNGQNPEQSITKYLWIDFSETEKQNALR